MAGRILPIALATVVGISIGVATFDGEFKEQRRKRLEGEYNREVAAAAAAAAAAAKCQGPAPIATSAVSTPPPEQLPIRQAAKEKVKASASSAPSSWSSMLGLWTWNKDAKTEASSVVAKPATQSTTGQAKDKP